VIAWTSAGKIVNVLVLVPEAIMPTILDTRFFYGSFTQDLSANAIQYHIIVQGSSDLLFFRFLVICL
jgi:hypothetical protein